MIRDANVYDIPRINELGVLLNENFKRLFIINDMLQDDISKVIVYEKDDKVVGFIIATALYETCDILSIVVDPEYRRQGIGTNLIGYLISDLGEVLKLVTLEVATKNKEALALYDKFGFEVVHTREHYYNGDDAYLMSRKSE